jgi:hypothetical protein
LRRKVGRDEKKQRKKKSNEMYRQHQRQVELLVHELKQEFKTRPVTVENWVFMLTSAFRFYDLLSREDQKSQTEKEKRERKDKEQDATEPHIYVPVILEALNVLLKERRIVAEDRVYVHIHNVLEQSGVALLEVLGECHYKGELKFASPILSDTLPFRSSLSRLTFQHLMEQSQPLLPENFPYLVRKAKSFLETEDPSLTAAAQKKILEDSLAFFLLEKAKNNVTLSRASPLLLSMVHPLLEVLYAPTPVVTTNRHCCTVL